MMSDVEEKGKGQGRGPMTRKGVQRDQETRITQNEADIATLAEAAGVDLGDPIDEPAEG